MITSASFWVVLIGGAAIYWGLPRYRELFLFVGSVAYLGSLDWKSVVTLLVLSGLAFGAGRASRRGIRAAAVVVIAISLATLAYFKYLPPILAAIRGDHVDAAKWVVPLGASYFTFKLVHYVIESSRGDLPPHSALQFFGYIFFVPAFAAGPIERFDHYLVNKKDQLTRGDLLEALTRILYGLVKKLVIVDLLLERTARHDPHDLAGAVPFWAPPFALADLMTELPHLHPAFAWQFVLTRFASVYLDFSAYSDVAIGAGLILGVRLGENFDWPILAKNPGEFWKRWHISLSSWCQNYVYLPIMARTRSPYLAVYGSMLAMGVWHGGNLNYVCWGLYHATLLALYSTWLRVRNKRRWRTKNKWLALAARVATLTLIIAASAFSSTASIGVVPGLRLFALLFGFHAGGS